MTSLDINNSIVIPNINSLSKMSVLDFKKYLKENFNSLSNKDISILKGFVNKDARKGIIIAFDNFIKQKKKLLDEEERVKTLYSFQNTIAAIPGCNILGLDEVGRGPLAGPLTVGGTILKNNPFILGLNDSKQIKPKNRIMLSEEIKNNSIVWKTFSIPPKYIDNLGISECLKRAFKTIIKQIEDDGIKIDVILLDGNPLSIDPREVNVVKGDSKCASIAAASIIAKVERDRYMEKISSQYPYYAFDQNKGYGTAQHIQLIKEHGLCPIHRKSFCGSFMQMSLF